MASSKKVVLSLSGGLDSTILAYFLVSFYGHENVTAVSFDYDQRHKIELDQAKKTCRRLGIHHEIIDISFYGKMAAGVSSMVVGSVPTPGMVDVLGDPQPSTYMPNRNMVLLSIIAGYAEALGADALALGIQRIDSYSYWDTTLEFYTAIEQVLSLNRKHPITFIAPWVELTKREELEVALLLGVPLEETWTCYNPLLDDGFYFPCKECPSCAERAEAFRKLDLEDPILQGVQKCAE